MNAMSLAEYYAQEAKLGREAIDYAHSIQIDAERLLGRYLKNADKAKGSRGEGRPPLGGTKSEPPKKSALELPPTLADLGLSKDESRFRTVIPHPLDTKPVESRTGSARISGVGRPLVMQHCNDCIPSRLAGGQCCRCSSAPEVLHAPQGHAGFFCGNCCPACKSCKRLPENAQQSQSRSAGARVLGRFAVLEKARK